tara:strand:- start:18502 stop:19473 length:972 start_codon:yes stop_codon:yes gene_type:complete
MNLSHPRNLGILLGVLYGISIRLVMELEQFKGIGELVSISFMFLVPFAIGFIRIYFEVKINPNITVGRMITVSWQPIFIFLLTTFVTLLEGSICILMALPAFMFFASLGGMAAGFLSRMLRTKGTLTCVAIFPLLMGPIELNFLELSKTYQVENQIEINSTPEMIWSQLGNVENIEKDELPISITTLIGIPSPISAQMSGLSIGSVRTSRWEKGVVFKEVITEWSIGKRMAYDFDIDPDVIPDGSLDKHVKLGGAYFSPLSGKYEIVPSKESGKSILKLSTIVRDDTNFGIYSRFWGELIFSDFHDSLLALIKNRSESFTDNS